MRRKLLLLTLLFMIVGTGLELLLLEHFEGGWQLVPVLLLPLALMVLILLLIWPGKSLQVLFRGLMILTAGSGFIGISLHLLANYEFEMELHPNSAGWSMIVEVLSGALPALAPGSMVALALIGYVYSLEISPKS